MNIIRFSIFALIIAIAPAFGISTMGVGEFDMSGTWSSSDGTTGTWTADMKVTDGTVKETWEVEQNLKIKLPDGKELTESMAWTAASNATAHGFFSMLKGRSTLGWGVCDKEQCQIQGSVGERWSEVYNFDKAGITVSGMKDDGTHQIVWKGDVTKK